MIETKQGLPNTCWQCGEKPGETWFAEHEDAARSGKGRCRSCAFPEPEPDGQEPDGQEPGIDDNPAGEMGTAVPHPVISGGQIPDDFTRIKGIGPARAAELQQLGLTTFTELATAEHGGLVTAMEANPKVISMWQSQAGRLAMEQENAQTAN